MVGEVALEARSAVQEASQQTFLRLITQYESALRRLAGAYVAQSTDREDLFQEIAVAIWQAVPGAMPVIVASSSVPQGSGA